MQSLRDEVARLDRTIVVDAAGWGVPALAARLLLILPLLAVVALVLTVQHPRLYHFLIDEDHVIEWSQFVAILAASLIFARVAWLTLQAGRRGLRSGRRPFHSHPVRQHMLLEALGGWRVADDRLQLDVLAVQPLESQVVVAIGAVQDESSQEEAVLVQARAGGIGLADGVQIDIGVEQVGVA